MKAKGDGHHEILIIRRGGGDDNAAPKGGAWKIAYADFVTAMMAFFLVMWLINSANEVTKARVASYFNPIKMTDASPARRGLKEEIDAQSPNNRGNSQNSGSGGGKATDKQEQSKLVGGPIVSDDKFLLNPYAMLDELVRQSHEEASAGEAAEEVAAAGDPFNPRSFEHLSVLQADPSAATAGGKDSGTTAADALKERVSEAQVAKAKENSETPNDDGSLIATNGSPAAGVTADADLDKRDKPISEPKDKIDVASGNHAADPNNVGVNAHAEVATANPEEFALAQKLREEIETLIDKFKKSIDVVATVKITPEGLLVILEDGRGRSMFSIGSAQPNPALVEIIASIGKILSNSKGDVVIRGHTDGRQFRNNKHDNWQLSTDRAHMATYMLIRGGLAESRVRRIEGYGSSLPVVANEPMLDANRRVEFLVVK